MTRPQQPNPEPTPPPIVAPSGPPDSDGGGMGGGPLWPNVTQGPSGPQQTPLPPSHPPYIPSSGDPYWSSPGPSLSRGDIDGIHGTRGDEPEIWKPSHAGELPPNWTKDYMQDPKDPSLWWPDHRPKPPGTVRPASIDSATDGTKSDQAGQGHKLDVNPENLTAVSGQYAELEQRAAAIGPQAVEAVQRIEATHGLMGYPVAVGVVAGLARKQAALDAKTVQFGAYSQRFTEHAAAYRVQDSAGATGYQQVQFPA